MRFREKICVYFDGVIHSYISGWQGIDVVADEPVPGAFEWLISMLSADDGPIPVIYSPRSKDPVGIKAMQEWFMIHGFPQEMLDDIDFPKHKPTAFLTIDDRALCFNGVFPSIEQMASFKPWYK